MSLREEQDAALLTDAPDAGAEPTPHHGAHAPEPVWGGIPPHHFPQPQSPDKPDETPDAMEVDQGVDRVADSEPEEDPAAMQIEMEMRGPPQQPAAIENKNPSPVPRRSTGGFTAINGSK